MKLANKRTSRMMEVIFNPSLTILLEVGTKTQFNKFGLGISEGIGFNYMALQQGKTIHSNDEILEINNSSHKLQLL